MSSSWGFTTTGSGRGEPPRYTVSVGAAEPADPAPPDFRDRIRAAGLALPSRLAGRRLAVDLATYSATWDGRPLDLTSLKVELCAVLLSEPRRVWSRSQLSWLCWGVREASRRVDVQLVRLRRATTPDLLQNVRGRGWLLHDA